MITGWSPNDLVWCHFTGEVGKWSCNGSVLGYKFAVIPCHA